MQSNKDLEMLVWLKTTKEKNIAYGCFINDQKKVFMSAKELKVMKKKMNDVSTLNDTFRYLFHDQVFV